MFGDIGKLMKLASEMKKKMPEMQARLAASSYIGQAGGGVVTATVNGKFMLVDLRIDPALLSEGSEMVEDLVKAAISSAQKTAAQAAEAAMKELTGGMDLPAGLDGMMP